MSVGTEDGGYCVCQSKCQHATGCGKLTLGTLVSLLNVGVGILQPALLDALCTAFTNDAVTLAEIERSAIFHETDAALTLHAQQCNEEHQHAQKDGDENNEDRDEDNEDRGWSVIVVGKRLQVRSVDPGVGDLLIRLEGNAIEGWPRVNRFAFHLGRRGHRVSHPRSGLDLIGGSRGRRYSFGGGDLLVREGHGRGVHWTAVSPEG